MGEVFLSKKISFMFFFRVFMLFSTLKQILTFYAISNIFRKIFFYLEFWTSSNKPIWFPDSWVQDLNPVTILWLTCFDD